MRDLPKPQHPKIRPASRHGDYSTVSEELKDEENEDEEESDDDDDIDIDSYLAKENSKWALNSPSDEFYTMATFRTFSGKETQV